jgi:hypothetical protein
MEWVMIKAEFVGLLNSITQDQQIEFFEREAAANAWRTLSLEDKQLVYFDLRWQSRVLDFPHLAKEVVDSFDRTSPGPGGSCTEISRVTLPDGRTEVVTRCIV